MERLTERLKNGQAAVLGCGSNCKYDFKYCNNQREDCPTINNIFEKLAKYEELEDDGKLLKLPCAVGDRIYIILHNRTIQESEVVKFEMTLKGWCVTTTDWFYLFEEFDKTVFLTREEAEAALKNH